MRHFGNVFGQSEINGQGTQCAPWEMPVPRRFSRKTHAAQKQDDGAKLRHTGRTSASSPCCQTKTSDSFSSFLSNLFISFLTDICLIHLF